MKKILLPTDFSDNAWNAAMYASNLFAQESCEFYFLHALNLKVSSMSNFSNKLTKVMKKDALNDLEALKKKAETLIGNSNHKYETILKHSCIEDEINDTAKEYKIDFIVMGTQGATGAKEFFFGSNTVAVIKNIKMCPIIATIKSENFIAPTQIAFPTGYKRAYSSNELKSLKELAQLFSSTINVVHVNTEENLNDEQQINYDSLEEQLKELNPSFHHIPYDENKSEGINEFIDDENINLLVMIQYRHGFIESIINEPVIKKIGLHPKVPFMIIPEDA